MLSPDPLMLRDSHPELDLDFDDSRSSLDALEGRRRETHAIRQLWHSLQTKKHRLRHQQDVLSRLSSARIHQTRNVHPTLVDRFAESAPPACRYKLNAKTSGAGEIPYHTAITKRPDKQQNLDRFNALTRKLIFRLPNVYDRPLGLPSYASRDIREWRNEVTKIVPRRPPIYTPASSDPRDMSLILPPDVTTTKDSLCMFQPVSPRRKGRGKEYVVNPEWPSEDVTPRSVRDRAHCVYNWPL